MKLSVFLSAFLHGAVLVWAMVSGYHPAPLVAFEEQGVEVSFETEPEEKPPEEEKKAEANPEPKPSEKPKSDPKTVNVGEAKSDSKSREGIVTEKPLDTEKTAAAPEAEKKVTSPDVKPNPVLLGVEKNTPPTETKLANLEEPKPAEVSEEAVKEELAKLEPGEVPTQSDIIPVPQNAPQDRPKAKPIRKPVSKKPEEAKQKRTAASTEKNRQITDRIGQLLNTQDNTAGGARREQKQVAALSDGQSPSGKLTQGEYDALKARVNECWKIPIFVDTTNLEIALDMELSSSGEIVRIPRVIVNGVQNPAHKTAIVGSLARNLRVGTCQLSDVLPKGKFGIWKDVRIIYDPRDF